MSDHDFIDSRASRNLRAYEQVTLNLVTNEWKSALEMGANEVALLRLRNLGIVEEKEQVVKTFKGNTVKVRLFRKAQPCE